jgi:N-acetylglutamate synthase-like GNAT family acetyltransferase
MRNEKGPFALAHFERHRSEIISVVVRDDMEGKDFATQLVQTLQATEDFLKVLPVTRRGKALAKKCGFVENKSDSYWYWQRAKGD